MLSPRIEHVIFLRDGALVAALEATSRGGWARTWDMARRGRVDTTSRRPSARSKQPKTRGSGRPRRAARAQRAPKGLRRAWPRGLRGSAGIGRWCGVLAGPALPPRPEPDFTTLLGGASSNLPRNLQYVTHSKVHNCGFDMHACRHASHTSEN